MATSQNKEKFEDYEGFVEKFKPKKTTDDCYTPLLVYEAIANWVANEYKLDKSEFMRPFSLAATMKRKITAAVLLWTIRRFPYSQKSCAFTLSEI